MTSGLQLKLGIVDILVLDTIVHPTFALLELNIILQNHSIRSIQPFVYITTLPTLQPWRIPADIFCAVRVKWIISTDQPYPYLFAEGHLYKV